MGGQRDPGADLDQPPREQETLAKIVPAVGVPDLPVLALKIERRLRLRGQHEIHTLLKILVERDRRIFRQRVGIAPHPVKRRTRNASVTASVRSAMKPAWHDNCSMSR